MRATIFSAIVLLLSACGAKTRIDPALATDADLLNRNEKALTEVIIYDVFTPPVSSRNYSYTFVGGYEGVRVQDSNSSSIGAKLHCFSAMPVPDKNKTYNYLLAATRAFFTVAEK